MLFHRHVRLIIQAPHVIIWQRVAWLSSFPPHTKVTLPALSPTMTSGGLAKWNKQAGDRISPGMALCEIETDKATVSLDMQDDGYLAKILVPEGTQNIRVGATIAILVDDSKLVKEFANATIKDFVVEAPPQQQQLAPAPPPPPQNTASPQPQPPPPSPTNRVFASPLARKLARESGVSLTSLSGTGPNGRILAQDVRQAPPSQTQPTTVAPSQHDFATNKLRVPHYYLNVDVDLSAVLRLRDELNLSQPKDQQLSVMDFILRAAGLCMRSTPEANASWGGSVGAIKMYDFCDVNVSTVAAPDGTAVTFPVVRGVHAMGLHGIAKRTREIASSPSATTTADEQGTFSLVNVGAYGVKSIVPVVRPGQSTALGMGALRQQLVPVDGKLDTARIATVATLTLSCDHRMVDGAVGAQWLQTFKGMLERPMSMLL